MTCNEKNPLLMGCSIEELRCKLADPKSPINHYWLHFLVLTDSDPVWFSENTILKAIVNNDDASKQQAKDAFWLLCDSSLEGYCSSDAQVHTHVIVAPLARWIIFYDWAMAIELFDEDEQAKLTDIMLDYAYVFAHQLNISRMKGYENQILSNAFCSAVAGYVFGIKHGNSSKARRLYNEGIKMLREILGRLPDGAYSYEGSTYQEDVVFPLICWAGLFYQEVTGEPVFTKGLPPNLNPLMDVFELQCKMIGPAGLLPGWDQYGFSSAEIKCGLALYAKLTGNMQPLSYIINHNMWFKNTMPAWGHDDRLWTLVWWPAGFCKKEKVEYAPWMIDNLAGALQCQVNRTRLFQCWDECGGVGRSGRLHVDPNTFTFEIFDSPIALDGEMALPEKMINIPENEVLDYAGSDIFNALGRYAKSAWNTTLPMESLIRRSMSGSVNTSNALIVDEEDWYQPLRQCSGRGEYVYELPNSQLLCSDATDYYRDRYDIGKSTRASFLIEGKYLLVSDSINFGSNHKITWQAYLRSQAQKSGNMIEIDTAEQVNCRIVFLQEGELSLDSVGRCLKRPEDEAYRCRFEPVESMSHHINTAFIPQSKLAFREDLSNNWERKLGEKIDIVNLNDGYLSDPGTQPGIKREFRKSITISSLSGSQLFLRIKWAVPALEVKVNGILQHECLPQASSGHWQSSGSLPVFYDIRSALKSGKNDLLITVPYFHGETICGPVELYDSIFPEKTAVHKKSEENFALQVGDKMIDILANHQHAPISWLSGKTDAAFAVLTSEKVIEAYQFMILDLPGNVTIKSSAPINASWSKHGLSLKRLYDETLIAVEWANSQLQIDLSVYLSVSFRGERPLPISIESTSDIPLILNGDPKEDLVTDGKHVHLTVTPVDEVLIPASVRTEDELYAAVEKYGVGCSGLLVKSLTASGWRLQVAAAEICGRYQLNDAVPVLLNLFEKEGNASSYPPINHYWRWSKMLRSPDEKCQFRDDQERPEAEKRWRLKAAIVKALGKIGDSRAVPPLLKALDDDNDFYTVTSQLPLALARLNAVECIPILERNFHHVEVNTSAHSRLALQFLKHDIDRHAFEQQAN